ncbi:hypothetical protein JXB31_03575 [Candidatus Woesearchaeota archaeon]|nr:hypothetical protein [Candidatus Woesearchaeota archaeon]
MQETDGSYTSTTEINCAALYKVAELHGVKLPEPMIHTYLAGVLQKVNNPKEQERISRFVVSSIDELAIVEQKHQFDDFPNIVPYHFARNSGDFFINWNAIASEKRDYDFPSACYSIAEFHSKKIGYENLSVIFGVIALNTEEYINLLGLYHEHLRHDTDFEVNDADFESMKKHLKISFEKKETKIVHPTLRQKSTDRLLF